MSEKEYIVRETGYPGAVKQEVVGELVRCKDCKHFHRNMPYIISGFPIFGHDVCDFWGDGCKTAEDGFCSYAERESDG